MKDYAKYIPKIHPEGLYIEMALNIQQCKCCNKNMIPKISQFGIFPQRCDLIQEAQMKEAGVVYSTNILVDDEPICIECQEAGKADFLCALCNERKPSKKVEFSIGYPAEFLCKDCYETVPAKIWDEKCEILKKEHKYDFY